AGDEQRDHERDDGHADGVDPEDANGSDDVGRAQKRGVAGGGNGGADDHGQAEGEEDPRALFHRYIMRSPPLISSDAPVMYPAASEAAKQIRSATSSAVPRRGTG